MSITTDRRGFVKRTALAGIGLGLTKAAWTINPLLTKSEGKRIGMIGLDTGHCMSFTTKLNDPNAGNKYGGYQVVAAYPNGTEEIKVWKDKIPGITKEIQGQGVEIVDSMSQLLSKVDVVLITCIDGNKHLEQALPVFRSGKSVFIDKPFAGSLSDAIAIAEAAKKYQVPLFSTSSLRYIGGVQQIEKGKIGLVTGADVYSPAYLEAHHPDLFWYGVHGVEILFTVMGTGCVKVKRTFTENMDAVVGVWEDGRIGYFRGIRTGRGGYGGTVYGEKGILVLDKFQGDHALLEKMTEFFHSGVSPVPIEETLQIFAFMQAAEESKKRGGVFVDLKTVFKKARS